MGLMRLGDILNAQYKSEEGFAYWRQAVGLARSQHLSEHERLSIESRYQLEIRDFQAAEPVLREWVRKFPNDSLAPRLLASCLLGLGRYEDAISAASGAQERFGPTVFGTSVLIRGLAAKNRAADVEVQTQVLEKLSAHTLALRFQGMAAAIREDYDSASRLFRELATAAQGEEASRAVGLLAILEADRGRMEEARGIFSDSIEKDREAGENGLASQKIVALAFLEGRAGNGELARALVQEAVALRPSPQVFVESVTILARHGYIDDARRLMKKFPAGDGPRFEVGSLRMKGEILAATGDFRQAVAVLDLAARTDRANEPQEYLARVLDLAGNRERAKLIYRNIADRPWLIWDLVEEQWPGTRFIAKEYLKKTEGE